MNRNILVVAAHPDDEVLGLGGTVRKWCNEGAEIHAVILAQGITSRGDTGESLDIELANLRGQARRSADIVGYQEVLFENLPDNRMDNIDLLDITRIIEKYINNFKPQVVLTHHHGDLNIDHQLTYQAVLTACRPMLGCSVKELYTFETLSSSEWNFPYYKNGFSPNLFVDITDTIQVKLEAVGCYTSEIRQAPHPRSLGVIKDAATRWGSVAGFSYAEPFEQIFRLM